MGKYSYGVVHADIICHDCDWKTQSYKNAQAIAKIHAKKYGHMVSGELGIGLSYDYRSDGPTIKRKSGK
jgi:hypothetical protein